jgi:hypothetical protein
VNRPYTKSERLENQIANAIFNANEAKFRADCAIVALERLREMVKPKPKKQALP